MKPLICAALGALGVWTGSASAADPPRVERLSNPQSQTVGKKFCNGVWVPSFDPCPGTGTSSGGGAAPAGAAPATPNSPPRPRNDPPAAQDRERARGLQRQAWDYMLGSGGVQSNPPRAFALFQEVCMLAADLEGCGQAARMLIDDPTEYGSDLPIGRPPNPDLAALRRLAIMLADRGCRAGDWHACFAYSYAAQEEGRYAGLPVFVGIEAQEFQAYAASRREYQREKQKSAAAAARPPATATAAVAAPASPSPPRAASAEEDSLARQARQLLEARKLDEAKVLLAQGTARFPASVQLWRLTGLLGYERDDTAMALTGFERLVALEPARKSNRLEYASLLCESKRAREATVQYAWVLEREPGDFEALSSYNVCRMRMGMARAARFEPLPSGTRP